MPVDNLEKLISVPSEVEASMIVNLLGDHGISARAVGGFTSGFKAEVPGNVDVLVNGGDTERASAVLLEVRKEPWRPNDELHETLSSDHQGAEERQGNQRQRLLLIGLFVIVASGLLTLVLQILS